MEIRPQILFDRMLSAPPRLSLVLLDWSCRESFHIFEYLAKQDVPRDSFEVVWIEYYDHQASEIGQRLQDAALRRQALEADLIWKSIRRSSLIIS